MRAHTNIESFVPIALVGEAEVSPEVSGRISPDPPPNADARLHSNSFAETAVRRGVLDFQTREYQWGSRF